MHRASREYLSAGPPSPWPSCSTPLPDRLMETVDEVPLAFDRHVEVRRTAVRAAHAVHGFLCSALQFDRFRREDEERLLQLGMAEHVRLQPLADQFVRGALNGRRGF